MIHNYDSSRNKIVASCLETTKKGLESSGFAVETRWIGFQSALPEHFTPKQLQSATPREIFLAKLSYQRQRRNKYARRAIAQILVSGLRFLLRRPPKNDDFRKIFINEKHQRAWFAILDGDANYGIVLENDAFLRPDIVEWLSQKVAPLLKRLSSDSCGKPALIDMVGDGTDQIKQSKRVDEAVGEIRIEHSSDRAESLIRSGAPYIIDKNFAA